MSPQLFMPKPVSAASGTAVRPSPPRLSTSTPVASDDQHRSWPDPAQSLHPVHATVGYNRARDADTDRRSRSRDDRRSTSRPKKRKPWRKLLWVKQDYPDNWVDPTFLNQLQRNINVHPYDFWGLVADSTTVVQHLSSVVIFVNSFILIYREQVSPVTVTTVSTILTIVGWLVWDHANESQERAMPAVASDAQSSGPAAVTRDSADKSERKKETGLGLDIPSATSDVERSSPGSYFPPYSPLPPYYAYSPPAPGPEVQDSAPTFSDFTPAHRRQRLLHTAKSALLIYFTLLGLSPILRSLTTSITSDSIWALALWLFVVNCLSFDYSGAGVASFSTNAAITASVVLASRLPSTTHVFSLILFSIQVFGLLPMFRRFVKLVSWTSHVSLTAALVLGAAAGLGAVAGWQWAAVWTGGVVLGMGGCAWWMIDMQKYKNEIHGPWDPARPVFRRQW